MLEGVENKNIDFVLLGESEGNILSALMILQREILQKNFGTILYQNNLYSKVINKNDRSKKIFRVIHAKLPNSEFLNLQKIAVNFYGATGDQSYSEAISAGSVVFYDCQAWKTPFSISMKELALEIDPRPIVTNQLSLARTIQLLTKKLIPDEVRELAKLLKSPDIQKLLYQFREKIYCDKNLHKNLNKILDILVLNDPGCSIS